MMNKKQNIPIPKRGEIWLVEFLPTKESRKPIRPCLVISNDIQNEYGKWIVIVALTTKDIKNIEPFEVFVEKTKEKIFSSPKISQKPPNLPHFLEH